MNVWGKQNCLKKFALKSNLTRNNGNAPSDGVISFSRLSSPSCLAFEGRYVVENANGFLNETEGKGKADGKENIPDFSQILPSPWHSVK